MANLDPYDIIKYPLSTEKAVREMEAANTLIFIVANSATKSKIKWAVEKAFGVKVIGIRTANTIKGKKKAFVKLSSDTSAVEVTTQLGLV